MAYRYPFSGTKWRNFFSQDDPILPTTSVTELALEAFAPLASFGGNDGHPTDLYDSLEQDIAGQNAEAIYFTTYATELLADDAYSMGHAHQGEDSEIEWLSVWQSNVPTGLGAATNIGNAGAAYWDSQSYQEVGWAVIALGQFGVSGQTFFYFRARGTAPAPGTGSATDLDLKITIFSQAASPSHEVTQQLGDPFILKIPNGITNQWVTAPPFDLGSAFIALPNNQNWKFIYPKFEIRAGSSPGAVALYEIQVGRIGGK